MTRVMCLFVGLLLLIASPCFVAAQGFGGGGGFPGGSLFASVPGLGSIDVGGMRLMPNVRVGYQKIGLNFNLPVPSGIAFFGDNSAPIDLQLTDANVWVGAVSLEGRVSPRLSLFLNGEANAKRNSGAITNEEPLQHISGLVPSQWTASQLEWWSIGVGGTYAISNDIAIVGGLRREHLSFGLTDPRDAAGVPINTQLSVPGIVLLTLENAADFQLKLWVPYVGIQFSGQSYRARLNWSPFLGASVKLPDQLIQNIFVFVAPGVTVLQDFEWKYSMNRTGTLLEGDFEYDLRFSANAAVKLWAKGSWLQVRGSGNLDQIVDQFIAIGGVPIPIPQASGSSSDTATLARYVTAAGLAAELAF